jgi:hypothetical protein
MSDEIFSQVRLNNIGSSAVLVERHNNVGGGQEDQETLARGASRTNLVNSNSALWLTSNSAASVTITTNDDYPDSSTVVTQHPLFVGGTDTVLETIDPDLSYTATFDSSSAIVLTVVPTA